MRPWPHQRQPHSAGCRPFLQCSPLSPIEHKTLRGGSIENGGEYVIEYPVVPKEGRTIWVEGRGHAQFDEQGAPLSMAGICMVGYFLTSGPQASRREGRLLEAGPALRRPRPSPAPRSRTVRVPRGRVRRW